MKFKILPFIIVILCIVCYFVITYQQENTESNELICAKHGTISIQFKVEPGRLYSNTKACYDPKTRIMYWYEN